MNPTTTAQEIVNQIKTQKELMSQHYSKWNGKSYPTLCAELSNLYSFITAKKEAWQDELEFLEKLIKRNRINIPISKEQFERIIKSKHNCEICNRIEKIHDLDLHHIIPKRNGGKSEDDNLLLICGDCHKIIESLLYSGDIMARRVVKSRIEELNNAIKIANG